jgi:hypothetical protein
MSPEHREIDPESLHYTIVNAKGLGREQCDWYHAESHGNPQDDAGPLFGLGMESLGKSERGSSRTATEI